MGSLLAIGSAVFGTTVLVGFAAKVIRDYRARAKYWENQRRG